ncbi:sirohydrochlorin chelatase [Pengzhenrongella frigida]|uniref:Sirohydrochlorin chelatase n=1 Tax=Pengzhenrongella frigida TaxID=1259133 RepID=A0A4Q5MVW3_9MICO|nr:sirohydrochlorin chelatase [Cellulomonas sp. HLT2-17]
MLLGCSHGTDSVAGRAAIRSILADVRVARPELDVRETFVDLQEPAVADAVGAVVDPGGVAVVVPLLLSGGFHVHVDIAASVDGRPAVATAPLGPDARLVRVLLDRLVGAGAGPGDAIVLAAAGSTDPRAAVAVEEVAAALRAAWPEGPVTVGYGSASTPRVPDAVRAARAAGAQRVVVASYLLAPGFFLDRLGEAGADVVTSPLAPDPRLADIVLDRYDAGVRAVR